MRVEDMELPSRQERHLDAHLSSLLTAKLQTDDVDGMLTTLADAGLHTDDLSCHLTYETELPSSSCWSFGPLSKSTHEASFSRAAHLCMLMQCRRVLSYISTTHPHQLMLPDKCGSGLLHSVAMANVLLRNSLSNSPLCDAFDTFQIDTFAILRDADWSQSDQQSSSSVLHSLCLMENSSGLRPLEFSMLIGAYSTFQQIVNVHGYILTKQVSHGIRLVSSYNLEEYDLMSGERRDKSPMLMLTLISTEQAESLEKSRLLQEPLIKKWMKLISKDMMCTVNTKKGFLSSAALLFGPFTFKYGTLAALVRIGYEFDTGFPRYVEHVKSLFNLTEASVGDSVTNETVRYLCSPYNLQLFLSSRELSENNVMLTQSPIWQTPVSRSVIFSEWDSVPTTLGVYLGMQAIVIVYNILMEHRFFRSSWMPRGGHTWLVHTQFFNAAYALTFCCGLTCLLAAHQLERFSDCTDFVLGSAGTNRALSLMASLTECSAVLYVYFNMFSLVEVYEKISMHVAFLNICFRKMLAKFVSVLPLLILWAYLVFGTLFYVADFSGQEFKSQLDVFYSPLKLMLNLANPLHQVSTSILHTLFVLIVVINIENFIIAVVSNEFNDAAAKFQTIYAISQLSEMLRTWRLYSFLPRCWRSLCPASRRKASQRRNRLGNIKVWSQKILHRR